MRQSREGWGDGTEEEDLFLPPQLFLPVMCWARGPSSEELSRGAVSAPRLLGPCVAMQAGCGCWLRSSACRWQQTPLRDTDHPQELGTAGACLSGRNWAAGLPCGDLSGGQTQGKVSAAHSRDGDAWVPMVGPSSTAGDPASIWQSLLDVGWRCAGGR